MHTGAFSSVIIHPVRIGNVECDVMSSVDICSLTLPVMAGANEVFFCMLPACLSDLYEVFCSTTKSRKRNRILLLDFLAYIPFCSASLNTFDFFTSKLAIGLRCWPDICEHFEAKGIRTVEMIFGSE